MRAAVRRRRAPPAGPDAPVQSADRPGVVDCVHVQHSQYRRGLINEEVPDQRSSATGTSLQVFSAGNVL